MRSNAERIVLVILSVILLAGALSLNSKKSSHTGIITIEKNGVQEKLTLKEAEKILSEERKVDLNNASSAEIESIPGIGPALAEDILSYKKEHGPFSSAEEIMNVKGIGEKKFEKIKGYIKTR